MAAGWNQFKNEGKLPDNEKVRRLGLLIVDDETEIVNSLREGFQQHFEIHHTSLPATALQLFKEHSPKIILTDQRMPHMSGVELLRKIKEINPDTVRILITGYTDVNVVVAALNEGLASKYITKPWQHEELRALVLGEARAYLRAHGLSEKSFGLHGFMGF